MTHLQPPPLRADAPRAVAVSTFLENLGGCVGIVLCVADSHPPAALALYRRGHLLASSLATASTPGLRAAASRNALRLEIAALGPEDAAEYSCVATNPLGNATASAYFDTRSEWGPDPAGMLCFGGGEGGLWDFRFWGMSGRGLSF